MLYATEGREAETFAAFRADLQAHGGDPARVRQRRMLFIVGERSVTEPASNSE